MYFYFIHLAARLYIFLTVDILETDSQIVKVHSSPDVTKVK